jgi:iron-sulfur cluster repair protein YtfE (RIC family)
MSLVRLGARSPAAPGAGALLLECHARIRSFAELALQLATLDAPAPEISDAAARVHRYFHEALPLHVADEEHSVAPRLRRFVPEAAAALDAMEREHRGHDELLARLLPAWASIRDGNSLRERTLPDATLLSSRFAEHLAEEERIVIPALARLPPDEGSALTGEMRARRAAPPWHMA